jgi:methylenetetrahydrofolate--tRNA-(uracil-5-)-methyltransferase
MTSSDSVSVIGAGLAGCESAWQLAERGISVTLIEMKPHERSPAHVSGGMAELVCSNSLRGNGLTSAVGLLKEELRQLGSLLIRQAERTAVPAGRALAVNRELFSEAVEEAIDNHPLITVERRKVESLPSGPVIVATGPLTDGPLAKTLELREVLLNYHDAIAPLVSTDSIDLNRVFSASRYEEEESKGAYLNCPFNEREYFRFVEELVLADKMPLEDFAHAPFFEGCLPIEELAVRGPQTLSFGPLKPVGLIDPATGKRPFAVVQLRREDIAGTAYNLVGFQTRLKRPEQKRVFRLIPGLEKVRFQRYGQVHRNSFVNAPVVLDDRMRLRDDLRVTLAGQISGVEGYVESIAGGFVAGLYVAASVQNEVCPAPPPTTAIGGLMRYLTLPRGNFQPSNVVWMMIDKPRRIRRQGKRLHREAAAKKALEDLREWIGKLPFSQNRS